jgi:hypothetical protein
MRLIIRWTALAVLSLFVLPLFAADDVKKPDADPKTDKKDGDTKPDEKKPEEKKKDDKKPEEKKKDDKWILAGRPISGEIVTVDENKKIIKIKVTTVVQSINQGEVQAIAQEEANLRNAILKRDANGIAAAQQNIANHQRNMYKYDKKTNDVEYAIMEEPPVKVRVMTPPVTFDDNGVIKKHTNEELKKLKGDSSLPGYPGEFSELRNGQMVSLTLLRNKDAKPPAPMPGVKPADLDLTGDYMPHVSMIVITAEPAK